jgi:beta-lactamase regulating signal transducer with metallopeptidase domain
LNVLTLLVLLHLFPAFPAHWTSAQAIHTSPVRLDIYWSIPIAVIWVVLSLWKGAQLVLSAVRLHRMARQATPVCPDGALPALPQNGDGSQLGGRSAELCTSTEVTRPSVFGFFRPRILIPQDLIERLSPQELQLVVQHEMEHLRRADDWSNLLQKVALVLFPLNPALYWVERRLCSERELACDDHVLRTSASRKAYAICLTRLAEYSIVSRGLSLVLGAWERHSELARRIRRILLRPAKSMRGLPATIASVALVLAALTSGILLARTPQLVSFVPLARSAWRTTPIQSALSAEMNFRELGARPQFVKAVMPQRPVRSTNRSRQVGASTVRHDVRRNPAPRQQVWVVLTEWRYTAAAPPPVVLAVARQHRTSYAAVQIANGWLIVQI